MNFVQAMTAPLKRYFSVSGRSSRKEYWSFYLLSFALVVATLVFAGFVLLIPSITVTTRRLHDTGRSGWLQLIVFIPFAAFYLLYLYAKAGDSGENAYGADPWATTSLDQADCQVAPIAA
jgi:uncharacterized membrane protein YhaH (DUF805 family)